VQIGGNMRIIYHKSVVLLHPLFYIIESDMYSTTAIHSDCTVVFPLQNVDTCIVYLVCN
jgi:hypothetical protein